MIDLKYFVILVLMITNSIRCKLNHNIHKRVSEINNRSKEMYGEVRRGSVKEDLELEKLMYPRGNRHKLSALSQAWRDYYECSASQLDEVTADHITQNNFIIMVFQGSTARLPCTLCVEPGLNRQTWLYSKGTEIDFETIKQFDRLTLEPGVLTIYNVMPGDAGVFWCQLGDGGSGLVFIEVVDKEPYTVVKPPESRGPHAVATEIYQGVILFTRWGQWSECSVCGKVGRRHRYGVCYVNLDQDLIASFEVDPDEAAKRYKLFELDDKIIELFQTFPEGLPCRSQYLPQIMKNLGEIQQRPSEIMIGLCKVPCSTRKTNETNNVEENGALIYPITQTLPKQPPPPYQDTIFANFGQRIVLRCPGTTLRDVPIMWRVGTKSLVPRDVDAGTEGRVYLNCRDQLVFTTILYADDNLYSCWQRDNLAGTVKLIVWQGAHARWNHHVTLVLLVILVAIAFQLLEYGVRRLLR